MWQNAKRLALLALGAASIAAAPMPSLASAAPTVNLSQVPLTVAVPAHPQIVLAVGNSESMDGNLGLARRGSSAVAELELAGELRYSQRLHAADRSRYGWLRTVHGQRER